MKQWVLLTSFVFMHTREAKDVSAYDSYIYAKGFEVGMQVSGSLSARPISVLF
jgi:hypothetical protein